MPEKRYLYRQLVVIVLFPFMMFLFVFFLLFSSRKIAIGQWCISPSIYAMKSKANECFSLHRQWKA